MQLDDLQRIWATRGAALTNGAPISARPGSRPMRPRRALFAYMLRCGIEAGLLTLALALVLPVLVAHRGELRYWFAGGAVLLYCAALAVLLVRLAVQAAGVDFGAAIAAAQQRLGVLRLQECHAVKWAVLGGSVVWLPLPLLLLEACTGAPLLAAIDGAWLTANLLFGLVLLAVGRRWAHRHLHDAGLRPTARALVSALGDRSLRRAQQQIDELAAFAAEPGRAAPTGRASE